MQPSKGSKRKKSLAEIAGYSDILQRLLQPLQGAMALQVSCRNRRRKPCAVYSLKWQSIIFMSHQFFFFLDWTGPTIEALNLCALPYCILLCQVQIGSRSKTSLYVTSWTIPMSTIVKLPEVLITDHLLVSWNNIKQVFEPKSVRANVKIRFSRLSTNQQHSLLEHDGASSNAASGHVLILNWSLFHGSVIQSATGFGHCLSFYHPFSGQRISDTYHCFCKIDTDMS